jgi:hypothetical protein
LPQSRIHIILLLTCFFLFQKDILGQQRNSFVCQIKDEIKNSISGATVIIKKEVTSKIQLQFGIADLNGIVNIDIENVTIPYYVSISSVGYKPIGFTVQNQIFDSTIILIKGKNELPEVNVKSNVDIITKGDTTIYNVEKFQKGNEQNLQELINNLPGLIKLQDGTFIFKGKLIEKVLIEGRDLAGKDYQEFLKNNSGNGVEKLEVIENYKDIGNLFERFGNANQTVINIRYKNKKIKLFGGANVTALWFNKRYEFNPNGIYIGKKGVINAYSSLNSTGRLYKAGNNYPINNDEKEKISTQNNPLQYTNQIDVQPLSQERSNFNRSQLHSFSLANKLSSKWSINFKLNYVVNKNCQSAFSTSKLNSNNSILLQTENQLASNTKEVSGEIAAIHSISETSQIQIKLQAQKTKNDYQEGFYENVSSIAQTNATINNYFNLELAYVKQYGFWDTKFVAKLSYNDHSRDFFIIGFPSDTFFNQFIIQSNIKQFSSLSNRHFQFNGNLRYRKNKIQFSLGLAAAFQKTAWNNNARTFTLIDSQNIIHSLQIDNLLEQKNLTIRNELKYLFRNTDLSLSYDLTLLNLSNLYNQQIAQHAVSISFKKTIQHNTDILLGISTKPIFNNFQQLFSGTVWNRFFKIDQLNTIWQTKNTIDAYLNVFKKPENLNGLFFGLLITYSNNPILFTSSLTNDRFMLLSSFNLSAKRTNNLFSSFSLQKILFKKTVTANINISYANLEQIIQQQNNEQLLRLHSFDLKSQLKYNNGGLFACQLDLAYRHSKQVNNSIPSDKDITSNIFTAQANLGIKASKKWIIELKPFLGINEIPNSKTNPTLLIDGNIDYLISKNLIVGCRIYNLGNSNQFGQFQFNEFTTNVSQVQLLPSYFLLNAILKF